ncbi:hypothetical protein JHK84_054301 [Glycine max]|uniref:Pyrrolidone-carboxylate peptidase isoform A n=1 Tax=Glycine soja TaxID=3848 RepID=A0A445FKE6_GLYSO|nr:peptidase C15, pyroglutamyl peptidase I-like protein isoform X1 [Glycine max]KAG4916781.1 hypothetical protein JHK87_054338 [Glycine soja]KAG5084263.1 hypothetical protein JHK84_054301 [Glycine max]KAH1195814.1 Pyrrolidone-carboxylate peptidase [Glycine max]KAH1195815.1 Pyrrolidone-carboxylate peptidase [Glycine max]KHN43363.1 Pyrrolidone-carboxylate peptidase [Glycine soja]
MGSEGPTTPTTTIHVTGFKKFHGVSENPTETIANNLTEYMNKKGLPKRLVIGSSSILETAGQGALVPLYQRLQSAVNAKDSESSNSNKIIWLHFGVNSGATRFAIEKQAVNEANFRCPDEMGWKPQVRLEYWIDFKFALINKPLELMSSELLHRNLHNFMLQKVPIVPSDGGISRTRETTLPVVEITKALTEKGYEVMVSDDAGRFVCNYVYYHSLRFAEQNGIKSLFVHVPLFVTINEETQMQFAASLLEVLASIPQ